MKITWINFLHFYQPPTAANETIIEATAKSYQRIIGALLRNPSIKFTLNITGCLLERLPGLGYLELINNIKKLRSKGQIELTGSAAYHPLLAKLPETEISRQIKKNEEILKKNFGQKFKPTGFFIPEAAYSIKVAKIIKKHKYTWLLLDEISATKQSSRIDFSRLYIDKNTGLRLFFRQRANSKDYVPQIIFKFINEKKTAIVTSATDAELYGLRHADFSATFEKLLKRPEIETLTISQYLAKLNHKKRITLRASNWEASEKELKNHSPYNLWYNKKNKIQVMLWQLADLAESTVSQYSDDKNYDWARLHLDKGLASCTFWWASAHDFKLFGAISWNPDEIEKGLNELIYSIRALADPSSRKTKIRAEKLYIKIKQLIWQKHWHYFWNK